MIVWLRRRRPLCSCDTFMFTKQTHYLCPSCGKEVKHIAAGTDLKDLNKGDLRRIKY